MQGRGERGGETLGEGKGSKGNEREGGGRKGKAMRGKGRESDYVSPTSQSPATDAACNGKPLTWSPTPGAGMTIQRSRGRERSEYHHFMF